jgi:hypothetical protein
MYLMLDKPPRCLWPQSNQSYDRIPVTSSMFFMQYDFHYTRAFKMHQFGHLCLLCRLQKAFLNRHKNNLKLLVYLQVEALCSHEKLYRCVKSLNAPGDA